MRGRAGGAAGDESGMIRSEYDHGGAREQIMAS